MKVLITGGAGFIGSSLIEELLTRYDNINIVSLDNYFTGNKKNHIIDSKVTYIDGNTWDIDKLVEPDIDVLFHFGEYSRIVKSFKDIDYVLKSNGYGTNMVINFCSKNNIKLIYSASSSKFGNGGKDENLSPYSWTKAKNVELIKNFGVWYSLKYEIVYFYNVYGPKQIMSGEYKAVIGIFENQYVNGDPLTVVSPGTQSRDFTHIKDIINGIIMVMENGFNEEYMLGTGKNWKLSDVASMFTSDWVFVPERRGERLSSVILDNKNTTRLGWVPKIDLKDYIDQIKNRYNGI
jgi:UDP-glucose 4-epimerase